VEALVLVRHLPASWEALYEGRLDERKVAVLVELLGPVTREVADEVQRRVLDDVETRTAPQLRAKVRRLLRGWTPTRWRNGAGRRPCARTFVPDQSVTG
jgi:hypothetical protein